LRTSPKRAASPSIEAGFCELVATIAFVYCLRFRA
jgi:hypothetical protein